MSIQSHRRDIYLGQRAVIRGAHINISCPLEPSSSAPESEPWVFYKVSKLSLDSRGCLQFFLAQDPDQHGC